MALLSNGLMLFATPIGGAHYFIDIFAGVGVAVLAIAAAKWIAARVVQQAAQPAQAAAVPEAAVAAR